MGVEKYKTVHWNKMRTMIPKLEQIFSPDHKIKAMELAFIISTVDTHCPVKGYEFHHALCVNHALVLVFKRKFSFKLWVKSIFVK